jgi:hypothetical protein
MARHTENTEGEMAADDPAPTAHSREEAYAELNRRHEALRKRVRSMGIPVTMVWLGVTAFMMTMALQDSWGPYGRVTESVLTMAFVMVVVGALWSLVAFVRAYRLAVERSDVGEAAG